MKIIHHFVIATLLCATSTLYAQSKKIEFDAPQMYPEGVAFDPKTKMYYVSSVITGNIGSVDESGHYKVIYSDSTLKSSFGMKVDTKNNKLWICTADPNYSRYSTAETFKQASKLIAIDLTTNKLATTVDLEKLHKGMHFANDLTLDEKGNVYVTDSFSPVIYKVDAQGKAAVLVEDPLLKSKDVGLNGIVYHPKGFLITVNNGAGSILKVDLKTKQVSNVKVNQFFPGADGLLLDEQNNLILIQNKGVNRVFKLSSNDDWKSAKVLAASNVEDRLQNPTTATINNGAFYILNSKMNELSDSTKNPSRTYSLQRVSLDPLP